MQSLSPIGQSLQDARLLFIGRQESGFNFINDIDNLTSTVFRGRQILNRFPWPKVTKLSYKGDKFIMRLRRNAAEKSDTNVSFSLCDEPSDYGTTGAGRYGTTGAGRFWRICTEHHCFFRYSVSTG